MRKILLTLFLMVSLMMAAEEHLTFLDMPINGPAWDFGGKLIKKGFTPLHGYIPLEDPDVKDIYEGTLDGEKVQVGVIFNDNNDIVNSVEVAYSFPTRRDASMFYDRLVGNYLKDYEEYEELDSKNNPRIRGLMFDVKKNKVTVGLILIWDTTETFKGGGGVLVKYIDLVNYSKRKFSKGR